MRLAVDRMQTSFGYGVPLLGYPGERLSPDSWDRSKGEDGLEAYRRKENVVSIDGSPTGLFEDA